MPTKFEARDALVRLRNARPELMDLRRGIDSDMRAALAFTSREFTGEGIMKRRQALADKARADHTPELDTLVTRVHADAETVADYSARYLPRLPDTAVGLQLAQMKWDSIRSLLEAGKPLGEVIVSADEDALAAIAEWAPTWLEAKAYARGGEKPSLDPQFVRSAVIARLAQAGDDDTRWALEAHSESAAILAGFNIMAADALAVLRKDGPKRPSMEAAIAASIAMQAAQLPVQVPSSFDEAVAAGIAGR